MAQGLALGVAALITLAAGPIGSGPDVTVADWVARDSEIGARGPVDPDGPGFQELNAPVIASLKAARQSADAEKAAGRTPFACLPPPGTASTNASDIGQWLHAIPAAERGQSMGTAIKAFLAARFPCAK